MAQKDTVEKVKNYISFLKENRFNISKVYLFGSYARGNFREDSDIDLAIIMNGLTNSFTMQIQ